MTEVDQAWLNEGPPLDWFSGSGLKETGLQGVDVKEVDNSEGVSVAEQMRRWASYACGPVHFSDSEKRKKRVEETRATITRTIKAATGFTPEKINAKRLKLLDEYRDKHQAPFEVVFL